MEGKEALQIVIHEIVKALPLTLTDQERTSQESMLLSVFAEGKSPKEALGFNDETVEHMYAYAYRLYNSGHYKKAKEIFVTLSNFVPSDSRFVLAVGANAHRMHDYKKAVESYFRYGLMEPQDPLPYYYMYDCYSKIGMLEDAKFCLQETINRSSENRVYGPIKQRCQLELDNLTASRAGS